jgi:hypothetical protein
MGLLRPSPPRRPQAIWVPPPGQTVLMDPGLARARDASPRVGAVEMTPTTSTGGRGAWLLWLALFATWRYRRQLSPVAVLGALVTAAAIGHAVNDGLAWLPLLAGLAGAGIVGLRAHRPIHGWYALGSAVAGLWMAAAWWVGLLDPIVLIGLAAFGGAGAAVWLGHHLPRSRVEVIGGSRWPWEWSAFRFRQRSLRRLRGVMQQWPVTAQQAKVPRVRARRAVADIESDEYVLHVDLHGHTLPELVKSKGSIAVGLRARRMTCRVEHDDEWEHRARIVWARDDVTQERWKPEIVKDSEEEAS